MADEAGCTDEAIDRAAAALGVVLPPPLRAAFLAADGWHDPDGDWWVMWPLAMLVTENQVNWEYGNIPPALIGFGDDGAGEPFCMWLDGRSHEVVRWTPILSEVEDSWPSLAAFQATWCAPPP